MFKELNEVVFDKFKELNEVVGKLDFILFDIRIGFYDFGGLVIVEFFYVVVIFGI